MWKHLHYSPLVGCLPTFSWICQRIRLPYLHRSQLWGVQLIILTFEVDVVRFRFDLIESDLIGIDHQTLVVALEERKNILCWFNWIVWGSWILLTRCLEFSVMHGCLESHFLAHYYDSNNSLSITLFFFSAWKINIPNKISKWEQSYCYKHKIINFHKSNESKS